MALTHEPATKVQLPGFGLPYDDWGKDSENYAKKLSAVMSWSHAVLTIRERCMLFFIDQISDKPGWTRKVYDEDIVAKWKQEAKELDWTQVIEGGDCIDELRQKADLYENTGIIPVLDATTCVLKSDNAVSNALKVELRRAVAQLENVLESQKDWHPGSDGTVLDLVHPSLFPLVYERSRILPDSTTNLDDCLNNIGRGVVVPCPLHRAAATSSTGPDNSTRDLWSNRFQWLPCNVSFPDGENARIDSYINNLHPKDHRDLYRSIEKIITKAVPLWNVVYQCVGHYGLLETGLRISCPEVSYEYPDGIDGNMPEDFAGDEDEFYENRERQRVYDLPEPGEFREPDITADDVEKKFSFLDLPDDMNAEKKLQVIVKLANIHLTPEKPEYKGGSWHIEGQLNEHIVSTALYYYDNSNITESRLHFRTKVGACHFADDINYEQGDDFGFRTIFGVENQDRNEQMLGSVLTREDRLIAFPNGLQHRVGNFKLVDPTRPGHRKILALFLVAPTIPIISTANVPPQQRDWWLREVGLDESRIGQLPAELVEMIAEGVEDFPIGLEEAKAIRQELMVERGKMNEIVDREMWDENFSFCEH
ncbi:hypothetical protein EKO04_009621 [Ascochyta lentis]|uniref:Uncharacterized protein n=1 Tax=Ascochyta lentis TaxID=205686 RepID=A0A8H7IX39_9PLEO|nr:hypothetical protein EKO04_009621 [Ascochyta lentis]